MSPKNNGLLSGWPNQDQRSPRLEIVADSWDVDDEKSPLPDFIFNRGLLDGNFQAEKPSPSESDNWFIDIIRPAIFTKAGPRQQLRPTAYLDGLRGFAAFLVYWHHHQLWPRAIIFADRTFENGFGFEHRYYFACLPIVRTFFTGGHFAVSVFLVISGYVLSAKPLAMIYAGEHEKLGDNLASALFRRWLRLHLPVLFTTFLYMSSWHMLGIWTVAPKHEQTYAEELWRWYLEFKNYSFAFRTGGDNWITYNYHAWTIPVEFRGSIIVYTSILALSKCTKNRRFICYAILMWYFMYVVDGWFGVLFLSGTVLCELDILSRKNDLPRWMTNLKPYQEPVFYTMFIVGILLGGIPSHTADIESLKLSPGWYYLAFLKPEAAWDYKWFYLFFAATFLVSSIPRISWLKGFFETPFNQYLGRISFSLYLIHGPVLWTIGDRLYSAAGWYREANEIHIPEWINIFPLSKAGPLGLEPSFLLPHLLLLPLTLWLAEVVTKLFDEPSVKFSQWAYETALGPRSESL